MGCHGWGLLPLLWIKLHRGYVLTFTEGFIGRINPKCLIHFQNKFASHSNDMYHERDTAQPETQHLVSLIHFLLTSQHP